MSEQEKPKSFMQELDDWTQANVIDPLTDAAYDPDGAVLEERSLRIKKTVREKMLESYRNGQKAGPRTTKQPQSGRPA